MIVYNLNTHRSRRESDSSASSRSSSTSSSCSSESIHGDRRNSLITSSFSASSHDVTGSSVSSHWFRTSGIASVELPHIPTELLCKHFYRSFLWLGAFSSIGLVI